MTAPNDDLKQLIRTIPDHPLPGVQFRDITPLLGDGFGLKESVRRLAEQLQGTGGHKVAGIEARGFILGGAVAARLGLGFVPVRKRGKLPFETVGRDYELEYGTDRVEIHVDAVRPGEKVILVDDLIATGGTALAAVGLFRSVGVEVAASGFVMDLPDLGGSARLRDAGVPVFSLLDFPGA
ncbi:adenine phosphoribosyltransferase [Pedomonas mirosovicensis]|uniref:adenine phosphoribosyltransferase n=1 Tax=Pedomonas mirosovicensis TaxID=2908641 RepID=UPI00216844F4|nr:adenine phosphoribosyltransferase [Pedomonas mirosovicensis]MCH8684683.1 adenine phosphoribosyltransferase [Pedomonas mirosovicensis]